MAFNPLFYQLLLITLVVICLLVHVGLPNDPPLVPKTPGEPKPRRRRRSQDKPFAGLMHQPFCEACEQGTDTRPQAPGLPPPVITFTRGRKRTVDTQAHFCPDPNCSYYGWLGLGNLRANGHPGGKPWRQFQCVSCLGYFYETTGTIFHGKHASPDLIVWVIACLAEGLGIRGTARVFGIDANTVLQGLVEAAEQLQAFCDYFLHELHINQVQLDELYAVLRAVRNGDLSEAEAVEQLSRSPHWVWTALDPETKLLLCLRVGERTLAMAQAVLHQITGLLAPGCVPLFLSDGYAHDLTAIVAHFGCWVQPLRQQAKGPAPKPRWMPLPGLLYAQVVKTMKRRRIVEVKHRVVFGTKAAVDQVLSACGWQIHTAIVERLNLSLRHRVAAIRRRSASSCQSETGLTQPLILFQAYHNFVIDKASWFQ
jgi:IS1 family transposase